MERGPLLAVDVVIQMSEGVVLVRRGQEPFRGKWALPGGFVHYGERVEDAVIREAREETGLEVNLHKLIGVYSDPNRDPRAHVISLCFLAKQVGGKLVAGSDVTEARAFKDIPWDELAFDHAQMLKDAGLR